MFHSSDPARSSCVARLLVVTGVAAWLGCSPTPAEAQVPKSAPDAKPAAGEAREPKSPPTVSLLRVQFAKPDPPPVPDPRGFVRPRRFGMEGEPRPGTTLTLLLEDPDRLIEGVTIKESRITKFGDDKGTDLLAGEAPPEENNPRRFIRPGMPQGPIAAEVDPGGHRVTLTLHSPRLPASGAAKILLEADLALKYSRGERFVEQKGVNLRLDKITAGTVPMIVATQSDDQEMMGMQPGGQKGMQVILFHQGPMEGIKNVAFIGPDGAEIQATKGGWGSSGSLHQTHYHLARQVDTCTLRITVPEVVETATLAISVSTGVGFPPGVRRTFVPSRGDATGAPDAGATRR
ncbi:MAG: hypothetical protein U0790_21990 [Isosphaeraceae bacterium]